MVGNNGRTVERMQTLRDGIAPNKGNRGGIENGEY